MDEGIFGPGPQSRECRTSGKHVFLSVVTYKRQEDNLTSSDTLNLFRRATNFCLKLGCYREIERECHQKLLGCDFNAMKFTVIKKYGT